ncbi:MAG: hypothetical protein ABIT08_07745 [Bacteroidia bacterium]
MSETNIKIMMHEMIDMIEDNTVLNAVYNFLSKVTGKKRTKDFWDTLSDSEKKEIEEGLKDAESGRLIAHEEVMKEIKARLKNE